MIDDATKCSCEGWVATEWAVRLAANTHKYHDSYTVNHSSRVGHLAAEIGWEMRLSPEQIRLLDLGSQVHDIGKIEVPRHIIEKPGRLTAEEYKIAQTHAEAGYNILNVLPWPSQIPQLARQHHERLDGSGYPQGLKGTEILLEAQIVAVADITESMLADRPYRRARTPEQVLKHIIGMRGNQLNADAVDACVSIVERHRIESPRSKDPGRNRIGWLMPAFEE